MFSFKLKDTDYIVKFSFLLFNSLIFLLKDTKLITAFYGVCIVHEMGHVLAVILTDGTVKTVEFTGMGIKMTATPAISLKDSIFVLLAGATVNIIIWLIMRIFGISNTFAMLNLYEGVFNLMPFGFLDGGAIINLLIEGNTNEKILKKILLLIQIIIIIAVFYTILKN